jgi:hypothetical protein
MAADFRAPTGHVFRVERARGPVWSARIDPETRFVRPSIKGISTEVLWEHAESRASLEEIADAFDLDIADVRWLAAAPLEEGGVLSAQRG